VDRASRQGCRNGEFSDATDVRQPNLGPDVPKFMEAACVARAAVDQWGAVSPLQMRRMLPATELKGRERGKQLFVRFFIEANCPLSVRSSCIPQCPAPLVCSERGVDKLAKTLKRALPVSSAGLPPNPLQPPPNLNS